MNRLFGISIADSLGVADIGRSGLRDAERGESVGGLCLCSLYTASRRGGAAWTRTMAGCSRSRGTCSSRWSRGGAAVKPPLDVPQEFAEGASFQVRDELEDLVRRDLLGPWGGPREAFKPKVMGPRERYLVGMLGPRHSPASALESADEMPDTEVGVGGDASEGGLPEVVSPQTLGKIWASSMGLSFCVPADVDAVVVKAGWGRYELREQEDEDGKKLRIWSREPVEREEEIRLDGEESFKIMLTGEHEDASGVLLSVNVRRRDARRVVEIALVNQQSEPTGNKDTAWLFQPELTVTALDGAKAVFLPVDDPVDDLQAVGDDAEELHLRLLYRNERRYAAGRNVAVHADVAEGGRVAHRLTTTWLPVHNVPATIAPTGSGTPLEHVELSMDVLAEATPAELHHSLQPSSRATRRGWVREKIRSPASRLRCVRRRPRPSTMPGGPPTASKPV